MSRRKPKDETEYQFAAVDIECPMGHRVGQVFKILEGPRAGKYGTGRGVRFEESPEVTDVSGRVRGTCPQCGADVIARWMRVREQLERDLLRGRHTGTHRP